MTYKRAAIETLAAFAIVSLIFLLGYVSIAGCASMKMRAHEKQTTIRHYRMNHYPYDWDRDMFQDARPVLSDTTVTVQFMEEYIQCDSMHYVGQWLSPSLFAVYGFANMRDSVSDIDETPIFRISVYPDQMFIVLDTSLRGSGLERFERNYILPLE